MIRLLFFPCDNKVKLLIEVRVPRLYWSYILMKVDTHHNQNRKTPFPNVFISVPDTKRCFVYFLISRRVRTGFPGVPGRSLYTGSVSTVSPSCPSRVPFKVPRFAWAHIRTPRPMDFRSPRLSSKPPSVRVWKIPVVLQSYLLPVCFPLFLRDIRTTNWEVDKGVRPMVLLP